MTVQASLLSGTELSKVIRAELKTEVEKLIEAGVTPGLAVVLIGEDPASKVYVGRKIKVCEQLGFYSESHQLAETTSQEELLKLIQELNESPRIDGILVQMPLPSQISEKAVINAIDVKKDVDGFHPVNVGNMLIGDDSLLPCTPAGIIEILKRNDVEIKGKHAVIVGRSNIVGKPAAMLMVREHATVSICHSKTENMREITRQADILIVATGRVNMIKKDDVKPGAVVIDVGINRLDDGKLAGDVDFAEVQDIAGKITPVPGGVGPMTIAMLMKNTVKAAKNNRLKS